MTTHEYLLQKYGTTLTFQQASEETGIFWQTIREKCKRGEIKTIKNGRLWVLTTKALADYLDGRTKKEEPVVISFTGRGHRKIV
jgi:hypothetical protein